MYFDIDFKGDYLLLEQSFGRGILYKYHSCPYSSLLLINMYVMYNKLYFNTPEVIPQRWWDNYWHSKVSLVF